MLYLSRWSDIAMLGTQRLGDDRNLTADSRLLCPPQVLFVRLDNRMPRVKAAGMAAQM